MKYTLLVILSILSMAASCDGDIYKVTSPDGEITAEFMISQGGFAGYRVYHSDSLVIDLSALGLVREDEDFSRNLKLKSVSTQTRISESYEMLHGKKRNLSYNANQQVFHLFSANGKPMDITFRVSDDGVAFRYHFPGESDTLFRITKEVSSFRFRTSTEAYLQPCPDSRTGWEKTQPSYEEFYQGPIPVGTSSPFKARWVMPALLKSGSFWVSITEAAVDTNYCGSRLSQHSPGGMYTIEFPQPTEGRDGEPVLPESVLPWSTPWRIAVVADNLADLTESTLGTDLALPAKYDVSSWLSPGKASWSWIMRKDGSINYDTQKKYIDFASSMNWQYCLIDVNWDRRIGYDKMKELAEYAATKGVKLLLWYNSAGNWNSVTFYTPHSKLLTHESRMSEFKTLSDMGIAGIKVDFFAGDGQSMMKYYIDILKDAADFKIAVNFHGSTYPRGWARTYPNLVTMESIKGEEFVTFNQSDADMQPVHCATIPFTRNLFDPMDFTPVNFSGIPGNIKRRTTDGFEAALGVIFTSGIQHIADSPEGLGGEPALVSEYLRNLPDRWDDMKFINGYPGKFVIIARRAGDTWYIAGINGENTERQVNMDMSFLNGITDGFIITDDGNTGTLMEQPITISAQHSIRMTPYGGFVLRTAGFKL